MKYKIFIRLFCSLSIALSIMLINSCQKDVDDITSTSTFFPDVSLRNGILHFSSQLAFDEFVQSFDEAEKKVEFIASLRSQFNFVSLADVLSQHIEMVEASGPISENNDPYDFFVQDEILQEVLNSGCELIIGETIYKWVHERYMGVIDEIDMESLEFLREISTITIPHQSDPSFMFPETMPDNVQLQATIPGFLTKHAAQESEQAGESELRGSSICNPAFSVFTISKIGTDYHVTFQNTSVYSAIYESPEYTIEYIWEYSHAGIPYSYTGLSPTLIFPGADTYTVSLTMWITNNISTQIDCVNTKDANVEINDCQFTFITSALNATWTEFYFQPNPTIGFPDDYTWEWDFGDMSPISTAESPTHVYAAAGDYNVKCTMTKVAVSCEKSITKQVSAGFYGGASSGCGPLNGTNLCYRFFPVGGAPEYYARLSNYWVNVPFIHRVGSETRLYKMNGNKKKVDEIGAGVSPLEPAIAPNVFLQSNIGGDCLTSFSAWPEVPDGDLRTNKSFAKFSTVINTPAAGTDYFKIGAGTSASNMLVSSHYWLISGVTSVNDQLLPFRPAASGTGCGSTGGL